MKYDRVAKIHGIMEVHAWLPHCQESQENQEKQKKNDKSPEKSGENGGFRNKVMKSQEI